MNLSRVVPAWGSYCLHRQQLQLSGSPESLKGNGSAARILPAFLLACLSRHQNFKLTFFLFFSAARFLNVEIGK